ncbi:MAG: hypothetical protein WC565_07150 [Parcubacteria group bacterium]
MTKPTTEEVFEKLSRWCKFAFRMTQQDEMSYCERLNMAVCCLETCPLFDEERES